MQFAPISDWHQLYKAYVDREVCSQSCKRQDIIPVFFQQNGIDFGPETAIDAFTKKLQQFIGCGFRITGDGAVFFRIQCVDTDRDSIQTGTT